MRIGPNMNAGSVVGVAFAGALLAWHFFGTFELGAQDRSAWTPTIAAIVSPAAANTGEPQLTASNRGVLLSWIEHAGSKTTLRFAERTPTGWSDTRTVASGEDWSINGIDVPSVLRLSNGTLVAQCLQGRGGGMHANDIRLSYSKDEGKKWTRAFTPYKDETSRERLFASLFEMSNGGVGLIWLSGSPTPPAMTNAQMRGHDHPPGVDHVRPQGGRGHQGQEGHGGRGAMNSMGDMSLRFASFDGAWKPNNELPIDPRVCECCSTAAVVTPDGVLAAYRNRSDEEIRDIYVSRFAEGRWSEPAAVHADNWRIPACPINGPALSARGRDVAIAWYTVKEDQGHSYVAFSRDAGGRFGEPIRLDDTSSLGRVDVEMLADGSAVATWIEFADGRSQFRVRRVAADGSRSASVTVAASVGNRTAPRLARAGDEVVFAWTETNGGASQVRTASARVPSRFTPNSRDDRWHVLDTGRLRGSGGQCDGDECHCGSAGHHRRRFAERRRSCASGNPTAFVTVCVAATTQCAVADGRGAFRLMNLRPGEYALEVTPPGETVLLVGRFEVRAGVDQRLEITLPARDRFETTVTVTAPSAAAPPEVKTSAHLIRSREIFRAAGALQDVSRYVQTVPGVVIGSDDFRNDIIVRGGSPLENLFIVDNVEIPNINTFANFASAGGTVSILDPSMIRDVTFITGGYPASYTNRTSSVLQITQREGSRDRVRGRATLGFAGAGGAVEGPLAKGRGSWVVSARRSFLDLFTNDIGVGGVPVLYTVNAKAVYDLSAADRIWGVNVTGIDRIRLGLTDSTPNDEEIFNLDIRYQGWRSGTGVNWQHLFGSRGVGLAGVTNSVASVRQTVKDLVRNGVPPPGMPADEIVATSPLIYRADSTESETTIKYDATVTVSPKSRLQFGGSVKHFRLNYDSAAPLGFDSAYSLQPGVDPFRIDHRFTAWQSGASVQLTRDLTSALNVTAGGRFDRYQYIDATRFSPRIAATVTVTPRVSVKASTGIYYQQPAFQFLAVFPQNRGLEPFRADHYVGGIAYTLTDGLVLDVEAYRKNYRDYPVSTEYLSLSLANLGDTFNVLESLFPLTSAGAGHSQGLEFNIIKKDDDRWYGQANVSVSKARYAALDGVLRPGSFDYPLVLNVIGGRRWSAKWESSLRVSFLSGRPYTPFDVPESTRQRRGIYDLSQVNAVRAPAYFRADARVDRNATIAGKPVIVFLGIQNVTGRRNVNGFEWNRRANVSEPLEQLGVFPLVGIEWRF